MAVTIDLILDGLRNLTGSAELFGFVVLFIIAIGFLLLRMPILATIAILLPMGYVLAFSANTPLWAFAVLLLLAGGILYWILRTLIERKKDFVEKRQVESWKKEHLKGVEKKAQWKERVKQAGIKGKEKAKKGGFFKKPVASTTTTKRRRYTTKRYSTSPKPKFSLGSSEGSAFDLGTFGNSKKKKEKDAFDLF